MGHRAATTRTPTSTTNTTIMKTCTKILWLALVGLVSSQNVDEAENETYEPLGILHQSIAYNDKEAFPDYMLLLLPEIMKISRNLKSRDPIETMMEYMPIVSKIIEYQSLAEGHPVSRTAEQALSFSNRVIPPMMEMVRELNNGNTYGNNLPLNEIPDEDTTTLLLKLLPDITQSIKNLKFRYGGWPGLDKSIEIMNEFMPLARKIGEYNSEIKGRSSLDAEEQIYLDFAEKVVPPIMAYAQNLFEGKTITFRQANILQLIAAANSDANRQRSALHI